MFPSCHSFDYVFSFLRLVLDAVPTVPYLPFRLTKDLTLQVIRLSSQDVPTAYAFELEAATIVQPEQVIEAVQKVAGTPVAA